MERELLLMYGGVLVASGDLIVDGVHADDGELVDHGVLADDDMLTAGGVLSAVGVHAEDDMLVAGGILTADGDLADHGVLASDGVLLALEKERDIGMQRWERGEKGGEPIRLHTHLLPSADSIDAAQGHRGNLVQKTASGPWYA
ncbi:hypothetical protein VPH35_038166 [Triticum aestivum]|uniref:Uncharacterized protein n=1 Tax=Aegilops tauschii TaxID=37682 RepID=N1QW36_AEGTA